ncbi:MAG: (2Fe-2S)-binding protein [Thermoplasmata archaeon]|nr:(2Fe-2S)-binding protein [Thermoplasmata archaeon]
MRVICRCEDIDEEEVLRAIREGYTDLESLKRHLRIGIGPCQGRTCMPLLIRILARETGRRPEEIAPTTFRPPVKPIPLGVLADRPGESENAGRAGDAEGDADHGTEDEPEGGGGR